MNFTTLHYARTPTGLLTPATHTLSIKGIVRLPAEKGTGQYTFSRCPFCHGPITPQSRSNRGQKYRCHQPLCPSNGGTARQVKALVKMPILFYTWVHYPPLLQHTAMLLGGIAIPTKEPGYNTILIAPSMQFFADAGFYYGKHQGFYQAPILRDPEEIFAELRNRPNYEFKL
jgi:hypothetical protein